MLNKPLAPREIAGAILYRTDLDDDHVDHHVCVRGRVHATCSTYYLGEEAHAWRWHSFRPCDGDCRPRVVELPKEVWSLLSEGLSGHLEKIQDLDIKSQAEPHNW